jgi:hypothetical protein
MNGLLHDLLNVLLSTLGDVAPIAVIIFGVQWFVIRKPIPNLRRVLLGFVYVLVGLTLFLVGLEKALFPLGKIMAAQLTDPAFVGAGVAEVANTTLHETLQVVRWQDYKWVYFFAFAIGFATTIAEPALIAVALKANDVSGGAISVWGLRVAVGFGVAAGIALGTFRIVTGTPLHYYIIAGYVIVIIQTVFAPRMIIALAYDSGGVTTSTVTVPLVAALGLGLASTVPGRSPVLDGFGLIAFASLFPMITVMGYAQISEWRGKRRSGEPLDQGE